MCDYSLAGLRNRLAVTGEELIAYRFPTGSIGLTSPAELEAHKHEVRGWWSRLRAHDWPCAVCVPPGARLVLRDIPKRLQAQLGLKETEEATFIQIDALPGRHRDALRFSNNQETLLQRLAEGQRLQVTYLPWDDEPEESRREQMDLAEVEPPY
jgi:hypothetical protein